MTNDKHTRDPNPVTFVLRRNVDEGTLHTQRMDPTRPVYRDHLVKLGGAGSQPSCRQ